MKQLFIPACCLLLTATARGQKTISGTLFGENYTFTVPATSPGGGGTGNQAGGWKSDGSSGATAAPTSKEVITDAYKEKGRKKFNKALEYWNTDWDKVVSNIKKALVFDPDNAHYQKVLNDAIGHSEWGKGVKKANARKWDDAVAHYKKALEKFPGTKMLNDNIVGCTYQKINDEAEAYYAKQDWINTAAYYQVLMKNFNEKNLWVSARYSEALAKVSAMPQAEGAYTKLNAKVEEIKTGLPFINLEWQ